MELDERKYSEDLEGFIPLKIQIVSLSLLMYSSAGRTYSEIAVTQNTILKKM